MALSFRTAGPDDVETIRSLADTIWHACYPGIIPVEQIAYMLAWMYAPHRIAAEMTRGVTYELALAEGEPVGYLAHEPMSDGTACHLNKLYLLPRLHGQGHGQAMLRHVMHSAVAAGAQALELRVNRANHRAVRAYLRAGFTVTDERCADIGSGFVMDDFIMRCPLPAPVADGAAGGLT